MEATLLSFALLGFCFVPLGEKTGLDHARAILATPAASDAVDGVQQAFARVREQLLQPRREPPAAPSSSGAPPRLFRVTHVADAPDASAPYSPEI